MNVKDRCSDCICLVADDDGTWVCDEVETPCSKTISCPEGNGTLDVSDSIDDNGIMTIYINNQSVCEIGQCEDIDTIQKEALITEVLSDLGYEV